MDCTTELASLVAADCEKSAVAGTLGKVTLVPTDAIDRAASTVANNVITELVLKSGRKAATFDTLDNSVLGAPSVVAGTYRNTFQHDCTLRLFTKTEEAKAFINAALNSRVTIIVQNREGGAAGETTYEAYGWDGGLVMTGLTSDTTMADGVVYEPVFGNDETSKENSLPKSVWAGTLAETETMINSLATAVTA